MPFVVSCYVFRQTFRGSVKKKSATYRNFRIFIITVFIFYLFPIKSIKNTVLVAATEKNTSVPLKTET